MKAYKQIVVSNTEGKNDILIALMANVGFDSFEERNDKELVAYILENELALLNIEALKESLQQIAPVNLNIQKLENKNWNQIWESSFSPIIVDNQIQVRADFHAVESLDYVITIAPKMAFGTGHHATTYMMLSFMLNMHFKNRSVLDFGCGTAILSILAEQKGADRIFANDIEEEAAVNAVETTTLNSCKKIEIVEGGIEVVPQEEYDIILANVNTVALKQHLKELKTRLKLGGQILLSGILADKSEEMIKFSEELGFNFVERKEKDNWVAIKLTH